MLKVGDAIKCHDDDDMISTMKELADMGIETDFVFEKAGEKGLWLEITKIHRKERKHEAKDID